MAIPERFIDGIGNISIQAAVVRLELTVMERLPVENKAPSLEVAERLAMSIETLLKLHHGLSDVVAQLEDKGLIKKREPAAPTKKKSGK
ncbi:MAG: hypothetical protein ACK5FQ_06090 [Betaproteobacteria bacterium]|jgi:hypothetical protein